MQVKTCDVVYDDSIRCRMLDLRCRTNIRHRMAAMSYVLRHRMLRCRTCLTYDIDIRCRTSGTYDIVGVRCRTCMTYDIVCNIGIIRCRTSDVRHRTSARIQMVGLPTAWKFENVLTLALLKGLRLVHFFRGPLKELANAISGSPQAAARR
jgi:hypothetical protein